MKKNLDAITSLNTLIAVNTKRFERYKHAADRTNDINRKLILMNYAVQSQEFIANLNKWMIAYGTISASITGAGDGFLSRTWTGLREKLALSEKKFLLHDCEMVERDSVKVYRNVLREVSIVLPSAMLNDIQKQMRELEHAQALLKSMRGARSIELQAAYTVFLP
jgi:uncharacterized protein (TIGR02284 family)